MHLATSKTAKRLAGFEQSEKNLRRIIDYHKKKKEERFNRAPLPVKEGFSEARLSSEEGNQI